MKFKSVLTAVLLSLSTLVIFCFESGFTSLRVIWVVTLMLSFKNLINHFISLLLILEMFSLLGLLISLSILVRRGSLRLIFILIRLSVGEGVLGLALLVKFVRSTSLDQVETSII